MAECSLTHSEEGRNWPDAIISSKMSMNPYLLAMAIEESAKQGMKVWELVNIALWEKLGKPDHSALMEFAANMEIFDEDPKWKKRLKITARHEVEVAAYRKACAENQDGAGCLAGDNGNRQPGGD